LYVAHRKHGTYFSTGACDGGGLNADVCTPSISWTTEVGNAGSGHHHGSQWFYPLTIAAPPDCHDCDTDSDRYVVHSSESFGESTPIGQQFNPGFISWRNHLARPDGESTCGL
jgi:hypothetical protein